MAPKGTQMEKKSAKVKEDKGAQGQKQVARIRQEEKDAGNPKEKKAAEERRRLKEQEKKTAEARKAELAELFNTVQVAQKVPFGTDPKTVLCQYFKAGRCDKGAKCKFSHDLNVDRKAQKKDLYTDARGAEDKDKANDTMETWDEEKLRKVVLSKAGNPKTTTDIVCKYFLEAVETQKYGWFWLCPNGGDACKYLHRLPPGFVLKSKESKKKDDNQEISLEAFLETERHKIAGPRTPVNLETFTKWKSERTAKKEAILEEDRKKKEERRMAGKLTGLSGREVFTFNPDLLEDYESDGEEVDFTQYKRNSDREDSDASEGEGDENGQTNDPDTDEVVVATPNE